MERTNPRAVDLTAFAAREVRVEAPISVVPPRAVATENAVDFTDTIKFSSPLVQFSEQDRDNARILPPGATGPHGAAYKMLRTQVLRKLDQLGANSLGVMSAQSSEGKTLTAINLAIAIAADPARTVLLVDFDLRNPNVHRRFGYEPAVGVDDCLRLRRPVQEAMFKVAGYERLTILPARERVEHSSELLMSPATAEIVNEMRMRYANRVIIFDVPPVLLADDALAFARYLQAGLLVIGEGKTRRDDVTRTFQLLHDLPFVGTVLNGSREPVRTPY
ncbi:CpsD/CapB family tyrosine-protein kinase [Steroidobacter sp.]|uniref:CpsD/CapB family tyrosine-protein kinase n=1 Tax=Steroidobacter sp. TaxID=1978227 RepID=UPI001A61D2D1|nr:CpsD/CapB family tyrosine-protein kinase [Steroidobacter sp.]MBL8267859.1 CpsD/CapB family tyrosine-protein kinase [Steroidobacter sp.]